MNRHWHACDCQQPLSRRDMLRTRRPGSAGWPWRGCWPTKPRQASTADPLAPRPPHFPPRAKRVIFLFMHGGPSQVDTFDYKPLLERDHGKPLPFAKPRVQFRRDRQPAGVALEVPASTAQSGAWVSELFPHVARLRRRPLLHQLDARHRTRGTAARCSKLHTGSDTFVRPSMGSWITYGLGTENQNLPGFITICPTLDARRREQLRLGVPAGRLPGHAARQRRASRRARRRFPFIDNADTPRDVQRLELDLLRRDEPRAAGARPAPTARSKARIDSFELAFRMQAAAPRAAGHLATRPPATQQLYGLDDPRTANFGRQCLMARRFAEARRPLRPGHAQLQVGPARRPEEGPRQERRRGRQADRRPARAT